MIIFVYTDALTKVSSPSKVKTGYKLVPDRRVSKEVVKEDLSVSKPIRMSESLVVPSDIKIKLHI